MLLKILSFVFCPLIAFGYCPSWIKERGPELPLCPDAKIIPDTYPVAAMVITDRAADITKRDAGYVKQVVMSVLKNSGRKLPVILLPVENSTYNALLKEIDNSELSDTQKKEWKKSLVKITLPTLMWPFKLFSDMGAHPFQQDPYTSLLNPSSGQMVLRKVPGTKDSPANFDAIMKAMGECGFYKSSDIVVTGVSGETGGNIEGLPGGTCLIGSDSFRDDKHWNDFSDQVCTKAKIKVPTEWLQIGHSDEVIKVVRNTNKKDPCNFSVGVASPKKAIELLSKKPTDLFFNFVDRSGKSSDALAADRINDYAGLKDLCERHFKLNGEQSSGEENKSMARTSPSLFGAETARAIDLPFISSLGSKCKNLKNSDVVRVLTKDKELKTYQNLIQGKMDTLKSQVSKQLKKDFPSCDIDIFDVPNLFSGGELVEPKPGVYELPKGMARSLLPNTINSVSYNNLLLSTDPGNSQFRDYIKQAYTSRGLKTEFVDTYNQGHLGGGNLHCLTQTFNICRPRGQR